jgi:hypothetical protein
MKIVNILGGLGNQMFEYAMYLALREAHPEEEIKICTKSFGGYGLHNGLEINRIFGVNAPNATISDLIRIAYPFFNYKSWQFMRHFLPFRKSMTRGGLDVPFDYSQVTRSGSTYYEGYWQNENNFKSIRSIVLKAYTFPEMALGKNLELATRLSSCIAVSCHVRRGDYLKEPGMCVCTESYYKNAIQKIRSLTNPDLFCIFSDDIQWCKDSLTPLLGVADVVFVDWNKGRESFRDMQLMSLCTHNIIANSSFSWWGAWLNQHSNKIVLAPSSWVKGKIENSPISDDWIKVQA